MKKSNGSEGFILSRTKTRVQKKVRSLNKKGYFENITADSLISYFLDNLNELQELKIIENSKSLKEKNQEALLIFKEKHGLSSNEEALKVILNRVSEQSRPPVK